jgi:hypothetical protein
MFFSTSSECPVSNEWAKYIQVLLNIQGEQDLFYDWLILIIFLPNKSAKKLSFLTRNKAKLCKKLIKSMFFFKKKTPNFSQKIVENRRKLWSLHRLVTYDAYISLPRLGIEPGFLYIPFIFFVTLQLCHSVCLRIVNYWNVFQNEALNF